MTAQTHRIRVQRWTVKTDSAENAFQVRKKLNEEWENSFLPAFEQAFDELCPEDEVIHIPRIALQLRGSPFNTSELKEDIYQQLMEQLLPVMQQTGKTGFRTEKQETGQTRLQVLMHYLETGSLPWYAKETHAAAMRQTLGDLLIREKEAVISIIGRDKPGNSFYFRLLQLLSIHWGEDFKTLLPEYFSQLVPINLGTFLSGMFEETLPGVSLHDKLLLSSCLLEELVPVTENSPGDTLFPALLKAEIKAGFQGVFTSHWFPGMTLEPADEFIDHSKEAAHPASPGIAAVEVPPEAPQAFPPAKAGQPALERDQEPGTLLFNAGLVITHPFLATLFENCGIDLDNDQARDAAHRPRAASLLSYLASGEDEPVEFELGIIKVLLGMPQEETLLVSKGLLREEDREECDSLLRSLVQHWQALKNTSVEGLRQSFLLRNGLLYENENQWKLRVEPKPYDILLQQLPWSISIIILPWMNKPLFTEWPNP